LIFNSVHVKFVESNTHVYRAAGGNAFERTIYIYISKSASKRSLLVYGQLVVKHDRQNIPCV